MTKQEYTEKRRVSRTVCSDAWALFVALGGCGFCVPDEAMEAYKIYYNTLSGFAAACGCSIKTAISVLNLEYCLP